MRVLDGGLYHRLVLHLLGVMGLNQASECFKQHVLFKAQGLFGLKLEDQRVELRAIQVFELTGLLIGQLILQII